MSIPIPPTDNLYKFLAISGLVIGVYGVTLSAYSMSELDDAIIKVNADIDLARSRVEGMELRTIVMGKPEYQMTMSDVNKLIAEKIETDASVAKMSASERSLKAFEKSSELKTKLGAGMAIFGLAISIAGFSLWYTRVQKYMDIQLRESASPRPKRERFTGRG